jgi:hypothetical protein
VTEHLSAAQIDNYRGGKLAPAELLGADDHLAGCAECRHLVESALDVDAVELYSGLASCAHCAPLVADLRAFRNWVAPDLDREYRPKDLIDETKAVSPASWRDRLLAARFLKLPVWIYAPALLLLAAAGWMDGLASCAETRAVDRGRISYARAIACRAGDRACARSAN